LRHGSDDFVTNNASKNVDEVVDSGVLLNTCLRRSADSCSGLLRPLFIANLFEALFLFREFEAILPNAPDD
jgi:hypothetical protein